jgi:hypothetical protein
MKKKREKKEGSDLTVRTSCSVCGCAMSVYVCVVRRRIHAVYCKEEDTCSVCGCDMSVYVCMYVLWGGGYMQ